MEREIQETTTASLSGEQIAHQTDFSDIDKDLLQAALWRLPFQEQVVLMMSLIYRRSYAEIASRFSLTEEYVRSVANQGLKKLDKLLEDARLKRQPRAA